MPRKRIERVERTEQTASPVPKKPSGRQFENRRRAVNEEAKTAHRQREAENNGQTTRRIEPAEITRAHLQMLNELIHQVCEITNDPVMPLEKKIWFRNQTAQAMGKIRVEAEVQAEAEALKVEVDQRKDQLNMERRRIREADKLGIVAQVRHILEKQDDEHYRGLLEQIRKLVA